MDGCKFCPYRVDVPSGIWHEEEYNKLPAYDNETMRQPMARFMCHMQNEQTCTGWVAVASRQVGAFASIAFRLMESFGIAPVYLPDDSDFWPTHTEAAEHGLQHIDNPCTRARRAMAELGRKQ